MGKASFSASTVSIYCSCLLVEVEENLYYARLFGMIRHNTSSS